MTTVGILGGGQLARMLALAGAPLGLRFLVMDQAADACAAQFVPMLKADYTDEAALAEFASRVDVVTFDFENVPAQSAQWLAGKVPVFPSPRALAVAQDRLAEKSLFNDLGIATPRFSAVASRPDLDRALSEIGAPCILKTRRLGYDGKGQFRLASSDDADAAWEALGGQAETVGLILEGFVAFQRELSVVAVRARDGSFRAWPLTQNWHAKGILSASLAPADASPALIDQALSHARAVADELDYVGVFALELFERDGELLANEMAPRVHNSGHWTIEGAECSQFENHLRAVLGLPLGSCDARGRACMLNWVGELPDARAALAVAGVHWHDYGKSPREGRKVGHATAVAENARGLESQLIALGQALGREKQVSGVVAALG
ncbi:5-(carboxyamino)imidazole ribonucleotide synthase [Pseudomarimonas salicorniae]|uniref:N5-carboxyaminoimidazole ribonucleotide synthase n=1 Tax=Pseudomarimonas salicorniae TaxID=2933270 RepID=A0ABT0GJE2_9GAMM|nr:5-(carboxyamino)imidazole ribonucleotide synthase [Lysobacter sp. CAU 1642]